jgi:iron complex transport system substrate-binding protein
MIQSIQLTAEVLGEDAQTVADAYVEYLGSKIAQVEERVSTLDVSQIKTVAHGNAVYSLGIDGANTIIDEWITTAGGSNAAAKDVTGNMQTVSLEQILSWDPDVIITGTVDDVDSILNDPNWASLTAVKNGDVYCNPKGIFAWDRYGVEEALQFQWCAQLLYPDLFEDFDIRQEIKNFYADFLNYELSDDEVTLILNHEDPTLN